MIREFLISNWRAKLISLFIAVSIWYLIKLNLNAEKYDFPVPGTAPTASQRPPSMPAAIDESILTPLIPAPVPGPVSPGDNRR